MTGRKEYKEVLYLIDYGLSKRYIDSKTGEHVIYKNNHKLNGTARYASIHALEGYELSRRDDLESLCYVLIYLLKGSLPWNRLKTKNKYEKYKLILTMKKNMSEDILVGDTNISEFVDFLKYCRNLQFEEEPNYDYLRGLMIKCINKNNKIINKFGKKMKNEIFEFSFNNLIQNRINKRTCSVKKVKINLISNNLLNANKRNEITDYDNKKINETKSGTLAYIGKKVRNYSNYKKNDIKESLRLLELKKKQIELNDSNNSSEIEANNIKFVNVKYIKNNKNNKNNLKTNNLSNISTTFNKGINKKATVVKDNTSTAASSNENKKYSLTRLDLIKRSLGIEPKKAQLIKLEKNLEKNEEESNNDRCVIL